MDFFALLIAFQIVFESLPVSSSGHFLLLELYLQAKGAFANLPSLPKYFDHFLHLFSVFIILILFFKQWSDPFRCLFSSFGWSGKKNKLRSKKLLFIFFKIIILVGVVDLITAAFYFVFHSKVKPFLDINGQLDFLLIGFVFTTLCLFSLWFFQNLKNNESFNFQKAVIIGLFQGISIFPGFSRFALTYAVSRWLKISARRSFQISFLVQFPLILAGSIKGIYYLLKSPNWAQIFSWQVNFAIIFGTIFSYFLLKFVRELSLKKKMWMFGFYMLLPILILIFYFL